MPVALGDSRARRIVRPVLRPLVGRVQRWRARNLTDLERWQRALAKEERFWRRLLESTALRERWNPMRPDYAWGERDMYARVAERLPLGRVKVLDVGAGPISAVPKVHPGRTFDVTAVDPLAGLFDGLLREYGIEPWVRTIPGTGEALLELVEPCTFDVAHGSNSVDHTYDPALVIRNMLLAVKPGGLVLLRHERNEAVNEHYRALHQWNFDLVDGDFVLWRPGVRRNLSRELADLGSGDPYLHEGWIIWVLERRPPAPGTPPS
jgi:SAM-dependent methyltransferase